MLKYKHISEWVSCVRSHQDLANHFDLTEKLLAHLPLTEEIQEGVIDEGELTRNLYALLDQFALATELAEVYTRGGVLAFLQLGKPLGTFEGAYAGWFESEQEFSDDFVDSAFGLDLDHIMGKLAPYFDYAKFAQDLFINEYIMLDGYVFSRKPEE